MHRLRATMVIGTPGRRPHQLPQWLVYLGFLNQARQIRLYF